MVPTCRPIIPKLLTMVAVLFALYDIADAQAAKVCFLHIVSEAAAGVQ